MVQRRDFQFGGRGEGEVKGEENLVEEQFIGTATSTKKCGPSITIECIEHFHDDAAFVKFIASFNWQHMITFRKSTQLRITENDVFYLPSDS